MVEIKYSVFTEKSIRLLGNNQYTSNVESGSTRTKIKHWIELASHCIQQPSNLFDALYITIYKNNEVISIEEVRNVGGTFAMIAVGGMLFKEAIQISAEKSATNTKG